jgi:hypothetical protein
VEEVDDDSSDDDSMDEKIIDLFDAPNDEIFRKIETNIVMTERDSEEEVLFEHFKASIEDYDNIIEMLNKSKEGFSQNSNKFIDLIQKLKNLKNTDEEIDHILQLADENKLLTKTYKQLNAYTRKNEEINKTLPWDENNNIITLPL